MDEQKGVTEPFEEGEELRRDTLIERVSMREIVAPLYQETVDMGSPEFTHIYIQDLLKLKIVDELYKEGYRKQPIKEFCICAAVLTETGDVIRGHRHHDCFRAIESRNKKILKQQGGQGFITSYGRYVDREEGARLQKAAGLKRRDGTEFKDEDTLFSEDLY